MMRSPSTCRPAAIKAARAIPPALRATRRGACAAAARHNSLSRNRASPANSLSDTCRDRLARPSHRMRRRGVTQMVPGAARQLRGGCIAWRPFARRRFKGIQRLAELISLFRQSIGHFGRNGRLVFAVDQPFALEQAQAVGENLGGNTIQPPLQCPEPEWPILPQGPKDIHCPGPHQNTEHRFDRTGRLM